MDILDWLQSLKQFFIIVPYHILVASLTLMALEPLSFTQVVAWTFFKMSINIKMVGSEYISRGVEKVKFSTCPGTSKWP